MLNRIRKSNKVKMVALAIVAFGLTVVLAATPQVTYARGMVLALRMHVSNSMV